MSELESIFDQPRITSAYQPIVALDDGEVVGAEALARWPSLSVTPSEAFAYARQQRRLVDLDALCQRAAVAGAVEAELPGRFELFVNVEAGAPVDALAERADDVAVVAEFRASELDADPRRMIQSVEQVRDMGVGVALARVGSSLEIFSYLPFIAPDVIKVSLTLLRQLSGREAAWVLESLARYAERAGSVVVAEGIETEFQRRQAIEMGATLGQGWLFGDARPLAEYPGLGPGDTGGTAPGGRLLLPGRDGPGLSHVERQRLALASMPQLIVPTRRDDDRPTLTERIVTAMSA